MVLQEIFPAHKHGYRKGGKNLKISAKKAIFRSFKCSKKQISPLLIPLETRLEKSTSASPGKNPSDAHAHDTSIYKLHQFCKNCVVLHHLATLFNNINAA